MADAAKKGRWLCTSCGYHPTSSAMWCGHGCGSDYIQMVDVTSAWDAGLLEGIGKAAPLADAVESLVRNGFMTHPGSTLADRLSSALAALRESATPVTYR